MDTDYRKFMELSEAARILRQEFLKKESFYNGLVASIKSVLNEYGEYFDLPFTDSRETTDRINKIAIQIASRIIGAEADNG